MQAANKGGMEKPVKDKGKNNRDAKQKKQGGQTAVKHHQLDHDDNDDDNEEEEEDSSGDDDDMDSEGAEEQDDDEFDGDEGEESDGEQNGLDNDSDGDDAEDDEVQLPRRGPPPHKTQAKRDAPGSSLPVGKGVSNKAPKSAGGLQKKQQQGFLGIKGGSSNSSSKDASKKRPFENKSCSGKQRGGDAGLGDRGSAASVGGNKKKRV
jgi:hypothetical protein